VAPGVIELQRSASFFDNTRVSNVLGLPKKPVPIAIAPPKLRPGGRQFALPNMIFASRRRHLT